MDEKEREIERLTRRALQAIDEREAALARALAAEAALRSLRQAILDADIICDDDEKAGDRLSRLAAAIRAQGE